MKISAKTDTGIVRDNNQDSYAVGELAGSAAFAVVCDGEIIKNALAESGKSEKFIRDITKSQNIPLSKIMIITVDTSGDVRIIRKENDK